MRNLLLLSGALAALAPAVTAQRLTFGPLDVEPGTAVNGNLGVQHDPVSGNIIVSHRGRNGSTVAPHGITVFDPAGNVVNAWDQTPLLATTTVWGIRDMCDDGAGNIAGGYEGGIVFFDINGNPVTTFNGQTVAPFSAVVGTHRALAFDPAGDGGNGSIFIGDFADDIAEVSLAGTVLNTFPNPPAPDAWSAYGICFMPAAIAGQPEGSIWFNAAPNAGDLKEYAIDRGTSTLTPTGRILPRAVAGSSQGGLDFASPTVDGRGGNCGTWELVGLDQATPDVVYAVGPDWPGYFPKALLQGKNGGALSSENLVVNPNLDTSWSYDLDAPAGTLYALSLNFGPFTPRPLGPIAGFNSPWFFELLTSFTTPSGPSLDETAVAGTPITYPVVPVVAAAAPLEINVQALILDPDVPVGTCGLFLPLGISNRLTTDLELPPEIVARAEGANSFNSDTSAGFFSVTNNGTDPIVEVTMDWLASSNPAQSTMVWDTDQVSMADVFWNGNATGVGSCAGTYRNSSDVLAGLDYANPLNNLSNPACAGPGENAGCEATNQQGTLPTFKTLTWRFAGNQFATGVKFEFDIDTDGGAGITGDAMAGLVVTIRTAGGRTLTGELAVDPNVAQSSVLTF